MKRSAHAAVAASLMLGAATHAAAQMRSPSVSDPWEGFNRFGFRVFMAVDRAVIRPVALAYQKITPSLLRTGIHHALVNMSEPVVGMNDVFQGHFRQAGHTTLRFVANSTIGVGGLFDPAARGGLPHHDNGFDLTLGRYHVKSGPFVFLPVLGPSSVRDIVGVVIDGAIDPLHWVNYPHRTALGLGRSLVGGIDTRARNDAAFESLLSDATDPYATLRSVYLQNEQSQIDEGKPATEQPLPEFDEGAPAPATPPAATAAPAPEAAPPAEPAPTSPPASTAEPAPASAPASVTPPQP